MLLDKLMFNEIHRKAKAVLKKVNHSSNNEDSINYAKLKRLSGGTCFSYNNLINDDIKNDILTKNDILNKNEIYSDDEFPNKLIKNEKQLIKVNSLEIHDLDSTRDNLLDCDKNLNYLNYMNEVILDKMLLNEHVVYIGGWYFNFIVIITTIILLSNTTEFVHGFLLGIILIIILLTMQLLFTYSSNYKLHQYCNDLRNYIRQELERESQIIDLATIPKTGVVNKLQHTYKGWIYITKNEYSSDKLLIDMNPVIAFIKFGKVSLKIYIVDMLVTDNKRLKGPLFTVYKQYYINYNRASYEIVPENISRKRYWSKKYPIKLTYGMDGIIEKKFDINDEKVHKKILLQLENEKTFGNLPIPNLRYNRNDFRLNSEGGEIYLYALTGREKERWYQSLKSCIKNQKLTMENFAILNVDPFSLKVDYIKQMKELIAHHEAINNQDIKLNTQNQSNNMKNYIKQKLPQGGIGNIKFFKDNSKTKLKTSNTNISILSDENQDKNISNFQDSKSIQELSTIQTTSLNSLGINQGINQMCDNNENKNQKNKVVNIQKLKENDDNMSLSNILFGKSVLALNIFASRLMWDFWRESKWTEQVKIKVQTKIDSLKLPPFIKSITINNLDLGNKLPVVCSNSDPVLDYEGGLWLNLPLAYDGKLSFTFNTQLNASLVNNLITKAYTSSTSDLNLNTAECNSNEKFAQQVLNNLKLFENDEILLDTNDDMLIDNLPKTFSNVKSSRREIQGRTNLKDERVKSCGSESDVPKLDDYEHFENNDDISNSKMTALLNSKPGKKIFNVVEKLAQSKIVKKFGQTDIAKKMYNAAIQKLSNLNVVLSVEITSLKGTLILYVPPPPSDRIWYGFRTPPTVNLNIETKLNSKNIKLPMLTQFIDSKIRSEFNVILIFYYVYFRIY